MLKEFKSFALKGNLLDLAIAVVLGIAFGTVVDSLVNDIILSGVAALFGEPDFSHLTLGLGDGEIRYGAFLTAVVNFLIIAFALYLVVKAIHRALGEKPADVHPCPYCTTSVSVKATRCSACTSQLEARPAA